MKIDIRNKQDAYIYHWNISDQVEKSYVFSTEGYTKTNAVIHTHVSDIQDLTTTDKSKYEQTSTFTTEQTTKASELTDLPPDWNVIFERDDKTTGKISNVTRDPLNNRIVENTYSHTLISSTPKVDESSNVTDYVTENADFLYEISESRSSTRAYIEHGYTTPSTRATTTQRKFETTSTWLERTVPLSEKERDDIDSITGENALEGIGKSSRSCGLFR